MTVTCAIHVNMESGFEGGPSLSRCSACTAFSSIKLAVRGKLGHNRESDSVTIQLHTAVTQRLIRHRPVGAMRSRVCVYQ